MVLGLKHTSSDLYLKEGTMTLQLVEPCLELKQAFQEVSWDYIHHKDNYYLNKYKAALDDFEGYITELINTSKGINIEEGWVPFTTYWLVEYSGEKPHVIGNFRLRHVRVESAGHIGYDIRPSDRRKGYGRKILELGLAKAKSLNFNEVYLTVDRTNESSIRIIESTGGTFTREFLDDETSETRREYVITL